MMLSNASLELFYRLLLFQKRAIFLINCQFKKTPESSVLHFNNKAMVRSHGYLQL